jgi:hypothetical protein
VEAQVREAATTDKANQISAEKVRAAEAAMKSGGLVAAAKAAGIEIKSTDEFTRSGAAEGLGSPQSFPQAFTDAVGSSFGPINLGGRIMFAKVASRVEPDPAKLPAQREELVTNIKRRKADFRKALLDDGVMSTLRQEGKLKIHQDVIDRIVSAYRS